MMTEPSRSAVSDTLSEFTLTIEGLEDDRAYSPPLGEVMTSGAYTSPSALPSER